MAISFEEILTGKENIKEVEIPSLGDTIRIRPLTQQEVSLINQIQAKALGTFKTTETTKRGKRQEPGTMESNASINMEKQSKADFESKVTAIYYSFQCDGQNPNKETIKNFEAKVFDEIYEKISELNGLGEDVDTKELEKEVDEFH